MRVPVFSAVWLNKILHYVSPTQAVRMCEDDRAFPINGGSAVRMVDPSRSNDRSSTSLTAFDSKVAAGEYGFSRTAKMGERKKLELEHLGKKTEDAVEESKAKLSLWKEVTDDLAVLAR
jgi:hypothetical protein